MSAPALGLARLVAVIDRNRLTMDGDTEKELPLEPLADKWRAFGWRVVSCDGHDMDALCPALFGALADDAPGPTVIIAETVKGKGVSFMEHRAEWHYGALDSAMYARALADLRRSARDVP